MFFTQNSIFDHYGIVNKHCQRNRKGRREPFDKKKLLLLTDNNYEIIDANEASDKS